MRNVDRGFYGLMAAAWIAIGVSSYATGNVPWGGTGIWLVACCVPAGVLVSLLRHATEYALRMYLWVAAGIGIVRGSLYVVELRSWAPFAIWMLLVFTTLLAVSPARCRKCRTE